MVYDCNNEVDRCGWSACSWCMGYASGYDEGKDKVHFDLRHHAADLHDGTCGCELCITTRTVKTSAYCHCT